jgi:hypothetical protein
MGFEGLNLNSAESSDNEKEKGAEALETIRGFLDNFSRTKKMLPLLGILAIASTSLEAEAQTNETEQVNAVSEYFGDQNSEELKKNIEMFAGSDIDISHKEGEEILYSQSFTYASETDKEPFLHLETAGDVPHSASDISVRGGTKSLILSSNHGGDTNLLEGLKYRVDIAAENVDIVPHGDVIENAGSGESPREAILNALSIGLGEVEIDTEEVSATDVENGSVQEDQQALTSTEFDMFIDEYEVLSVEENLDEEGNVSSYSATLRIQPGSPALDLEQE